MCRGWDPGPTGVECTDRNSHLATPDPYGWWSQPASAPDHTSSIKQQELSIELSGNLCYLASYFDK